MHDFHVLCKFPLAPNALFVPVDSQPTCKALMHGIHVHHCFDSTSLTLCCAQTGCADVSDDCFDIYISAVIASCSNQLGKNSSASKLEINWISSSYSFPMTHVGTRHAKHQAAGTCLSFFEHCCCMLLIKPHLLAGALMPIWLTFCSSSHVAMAAPTFCSPARPHEANWVPVQGDLQPVYSG